MSLQGAAAAGLPVSTAPPAAGDDCGPLQLRWRERVYEQSDATPGEAASPLGEATVVSCGQALPGTITVWRIEDVDAEDALISLGPDAIGRFDRVASSGEKGSAVVVVVLALVACVLLIEVGRRRMRRLRER